MIEKKCNQCGFFKPGDKFWKDNRRSDGLRGSCIDCEKEPGRIRALVYSNRQDVKERKARYEQSSERKEARRKYRAKPNVKKQKSEYKAQYYLSLPKSYLLELIRRQSGDVLTNKEIPDRLITLKRQSLKLKRLIKQKKDD